MTRKEELIKLTAPLLERMACELVDLELKGSPSNQIFRFFVDHEDGITIQECASLSRSILNQLEKMPETFPPESYRIEVSSPGVQRPLKTVNDFRRNMGKDVIVHLKNGQTPKDIEGAVVQVTDAYIKLESNKGIHHVEYDTIQKANVKINWS